MPSRSNKGEGLTPLPTPQQKSAFVAALLAPIPRTERRDVNETVAEREVREDAKAAWRHPFQMLEGLYRAHSLAEHERLRWIFGEGRRSPRFAAATKRTDEIEAEIARVMRRVIALPAASRAQVIDKQDAYARYTKGVSIGEGERTAWEAAIKDELARFPKQVRGKVARDA